MMDGRDTRKLSLLSRVAMRLVKNRGYRLSAPEEVALLSKVAMRPQTDTIMTNPTCKNCHRAVTAPAESEAGRRIIRCFECGAPRTSSLLSPHPRFPVLLIAGWGNDS